jgi:hypothetical protein
MPVVTDESALIAGYGWNGLEVTGRPVFVTYSFAAAAPASHGASDVMGSAVSTFQPFDTADKAEARQALSAWGAACGITFLEVAPGQGDINFAWYDFTGTAWDGSGGIGFYPFGDWDGSTYPQFYDHRTNWDASGDVFLNLDHAEADGTPAYGLLLHEIGHALGFKHPWEVFGEHDETPDPALDNTANTVMSYNGPAPTGLGPLDEAAAAEVYGAPGSDGTQVASWSWNAATQRLNQTGFNTADTMIGVSVRDVMLGQGGNDRIYALDGNDSVNGGAGHDSVHGGSGGDTLLGAAGADTLNGGIGGDGLVGGPGNDQLTGGLNADRFVATAGFGNDVVTDYKDGQDKLQFNAVPGIISFANLTVATDGFGNTLVTAGSQGSLLLLGIVPAAITASDVLFA